MKLTTLSFIIIIALFINTGVANANTQQLATLKNTVLESKQALNLTDEQQDKLLTLLQSSTKKREKALKKHGISMANNKKVRLNFREKMALKADMDKLKGRHIEALSDILDSQQLKQWMDLHADTVKDFEKRLKNKLR